ncbi:ectoine hydroxylase-related dioxygenase (phytanoyl-CoA dioxygenase family) [Lewinella marina]|uniref:Phytanoyl-CoA dioxygenase n=1 Tax=Neolewinella marina TaxID=438751 RepID=A0A2G0CG77_9BACT|nr:phytanoyl-CoA dioxygenase family protein [Neolewinella marina]NJB86563.1 ectoine hydroxylase-related dioxygenase (phytanoyl-CoA dioxygenase family) [Neolewinella marina]PHK98984.1 phytanoyl-CoA dioxygenase [Neolewinella marina]
MLTPQEKDFLDTHGYLNLGQLLTPAEVDQINARLAELQQQEGDRAGAELAESKYIRHPKEEGADRLADLVNKGPVFDICYTHPRVLAAIEAVLGAEYKLSSLNYRAAKPGKGQQKLHVDYKNAVAEDSFKVCNSIWILDDFTERNGATRIVPGTHRSRELPEAAMPDPHASHPDEILITAPAGSVVIFNSHVWHGGTTNHTDRDRRSIHSYFCTRDQPQQIDQRKYITPETRKRIGKRGRAILDV